ncbi:Similarities with uniprot P08640 Saccharomyces cerevisiae YIR019c STA1 [Seminavis robusta]|uniref:Similarities with uniprot P08640 Saccharomyces cerevisiae YIR019c STA1 n=1 Tax=Seminavis robusta TaxID=568900 RepID=A0A9N8ETY6_9STRA|nr:Similarities with uniprot P08640 Saccharomyces cerevisiae YIR019c STA1 [Seminavis robusta]|eukprot:Sro1944_g306910.1 Similarities with uniprot P08640 Saccharomyces cerevisiae YIR019c STA1 (897) ;mRNA; r:6963-9653
MRTGKCTKSRIRLGRWQSHLGLLLILAMVSVSRVVGVASAEQTNAAAKNSTTANISRKRIRGARTGAVINPQKQLEGMPSGQNHTQGTTQPPPTNMNTRGSTGTHEGSSISSRQSHQTHKQRLRRFLLRNGGHKENVESPKAKNIFAREETEVKPLTANHWEANNNAGAAVGGRNATNTTIVGGNTTNEEIARKKGGVVPTEQAAGGVAVSGALGTVIGAGGLAGILCIAGVICELPEDEIQTVTAGTFVVEGLTRPPEEAETAELFEQLRQFWELQVARSFGGVARQEEIETQAIRFVGLSVNVTNSTVVQVTAAPSTEGFLGEANNAPTCTSEDDHEETAMFNRRRRGRFLQQVDNQLVDLAIQRANYTTFVADYVSNLPTTNVFRASNISAPAITAITTTTPVPSTTPSFVPSKNPSSVPSETPSSMPSASPSMGPSTSPSGSPSTMPSVSASPSYSPSSSPSSVAIPSASPRPSPSSSDSPSGSPSVMPSVMPSHGPSSSPSSIPSSIFSVEPSDAPSLNSTSPSPTTTAGPTNSPSLNTNSSTPSAQPSPSPSISAQPTAFLPFFENSGEMAITITGTQAEPTESEILLAVVQLRSFLSSVLSADFSETFLAFTLDVTGTTNVPSGETDLISTIAIETVALFSDTTEATSRAAVDASFSDADTEAFLDDFLVPNSPTTSPYSQATAAIYTVTTTDAPSPAPSNDNTVPSIVPSSASSSIPSSNPSSYPSTFPSVVPSSASSSTPSSNPSSFPSTNPSTLPSSVPSSNPSSLPSTNPSTLPSSVPSSDPSNIPTAPPTTARPTPPGGVAVSAPPAEGVASIALLLSATSSPVNSFIQAQDSHEEEVVESPPVAIAEAPKKALKGEKFSNKKKDTDEGVANSRARADKGKSSI